MKTIGRLVGAGLAGGAVVGFLAMTGLAGSTATAATMVEYGAHAPNATAIEYGVHVANPTAVEYGAQQPGVTAIEY